MPCKVIDLIENFLDSFRPIGDFFDLKLRQGPPSTFQEQTVPQGTRLAGRRRAGRMSWAFAAPVRRPSCVADQHVRGQPPRLTAPGLSSTSATGPATTSPATSSSCSSTRTPTSWCSGASSRRSLQARSRRSSARRPRRPMCGGPGSSTKPSPAARLDVDDAPRVPAVDVLDPKAVLHRQAAPLEATSRPGQSARHRSLLARHQAHDGARAGHSPSISPRARATPSAAPAAISSRARRASCCWPTVARASRSKASVRRATGSNDGAAPCCRPEGTR